MCEIGDEKWIFTEDQCVGFHLTLQYLNYDHESEGTELCASSSTLHVLCAVQMEVCSLIITVINHGM